MPHLVGLGPRTARWRYVGFGVQVKLDIIEWMKGSSLMQTTYRILGFFIHGNFIQYLQIYEKW